MAGRLSVSGKLGVLESLHAATPSTYADIARIRKFVGHWQRLVDAHNLLAGSSVTDQSKELDGPSEPLFTDYDVLVAVLREVPREHLEKLQLGCKQWTCMVERWENILPKRRIENMVICNTRWQQSVSLRPAGQRTPRFIGFVGHPRIDSSRLRAFLRLTVVANISSTSIIPRGEVAASYLIAMLRGLRQCTIDMMTINATTLGAQSVLSVMESAMVNRETHGFRVLFDDMNPVDVHAFFADPTVLASRQLQLHVHAMTDISALEQLLFSLPRLKLTLKIDVGSHSELHERTLTLPNIITQTFVFSDNVTDFVPELRLELIVEDALFPTLAEATRQKQFRRKANDSASVARVFTYRNRNTHQLLTVCEVVQGQSELSHKLMFLRGKVTLAEVKARWEATV